MEFDFSDGPSGCYLLFWKGEVVYVGQSVNVFARVSTHWNCLRRLRRSKSIYHGSRIEVEGLSFDRVRIHPCSVERLDSEEQALISMHRPRYNKLLNRRLVPGLEKSPAILELRKKKLAEPLYVRYKRLSIRRVNV